jgi:phytoene synthase
VKRVVEFECGRAREFYRRAVEARPPEDRRRLVAAEIMRAVYFETLQRVERSGYDVFTARTRVPRARQVLIALRQWLWP